VRLAREHGLDSELLSLALQATPRVMAETAAYLESRDLADQAVILHHKSGSTGRAIDLCFRAKLFDSLRSIADDLKPDTDPALMARVAEFFLSQSFRAAPSSPPPPRPPAVRKGSPTPRRVRRL
jgi:intraflagellar transport protein 140